jgi:hypothetical protein
MPTNAAVLHPLTVIVNAQCLHTQAPRTPRSVDAHNRWEEGGWFGVGTRSASHQTMMNPYRTENNPQDTTRAVSRPHQIRSNHHP